MCEVTECMSANSKPIWINDRIVRMCPEHIVSIRYCPEIQKEMIVAKSDGFVKYVCETKNIKNKMFWMRLKESDNIFTK